MRFTRVQRDEKRKMGLTSKEYKQFDRDFKEAVNGRPTERHKELMKNPAFASAWKGGKQ